jgi:3',5'-nucleoside bisphosphate phosphatase
MSKAELHTHSTASDGVLAPDTLVEHAAAAGVSVLALTDHDTTNGVPLALEAAARLGIELIPGIEINTDHEGGSLDILGYWVPYGPGPFEERIRELRAARVTRGQRMVERLNALGVPVQWERVRALAEGAVGRPHVARAMIETGYVTTTQEAFDLYLGFGKPAYVPRTRFTALEAVEFIRDAGGVPVLAHPVLSQAQHLDPFRLRELLPTLKARGLVGIEAYYKSYFADTVQRLVRLADELDLVPAGGSDFHAPDMGAPLGSTGLPPESVERLRAARAPKT